MRKRSILPGFGLTGADRQETAAGLQDRQRRDHLFHAFFHDDGDQPIVRIEVCVEGLRQ